MLINPFDKSVDFDAKRDIPALDGKVILVTGANIGLGKQAVLDYSRHNPRRVWLCARDVRKGAAALEEIKKEVPNAPVEVLQLDLASFASIKAAAKTVLGESDRLDILMLNAGVMAAAPELTTDGYEKQFGTNHMGHALLTKLLTPLLEKTADLPGTDVRVISLASFGHHHAPANAIDYSTLRTKADGMGPWARYGQSKMANILFARQLAKEYPKFTTASIHPGAVNTNLIYSASGTWSILRSVAPYVNWIFTSVEAGTRNQLWASVSKDVKTGEYYEPVGIAGKGRRQSKVDDFAKSLWDWTQKELEGHEIA